MSAGAAALPPVPPPQAASGTRSAAAAMPASVLVTLLKDTMFASFSCSYRSTVRDGGGSSAIPPSATPGTPLRVSSVIAKGFSHYTPFFSFLQNRFRNIVKPPKANTLTNTLTRSYRKNTGNHYIPAKEPTLQSHKNTLKSTFPQHLEPVCTRNEDCTLRKYFLIFSTSYIP